MRKGNEKIEVPQQSSWDGSQAGNHRIRLAEKKKPWLEVLPPPSSL